ncbi:MAG: hypothetical protein IBJ18_04190 [Phycisphaerales bacterium]|nr:hypothetical protein [Phycisphaerales bacterium]
MEQTLSPSQLARAIGVSESSLKRWVDEGALQASRTVGGHRRIAIQEAVRFIRAIGASLVQPDALGLSTLRELPPDWSRREDMSGTLYEALEAGHHARSTAMIHGLYLQGWSPAAIFDGPVRDAMTKLGTLWLHAEWGIVVEHRATNIAIQAISQLRMLLPSTTASSPMAIGCAIDKDPYLLPSLMASAVVADQGFCDVNLGPLTPLSVLKNAERAYQPRLVWIAASVSEDRDALIADLCKYGRELRERNCELLVGGRAVEDVPAAAVPEMTLCRSMAQLADVAKGILRKLPPVDQDTDDRLGEATGCDSDE